MAKQYTKVELEGDQSAYLSGLSDEEKAYQNSIWYAANGGTIKLIVNGYDVTELLSVVEWSGSRSDAARTLKFSLLDQQALYYVNDLDIGLHNLVQFFDGTDERFRGYIVSTSKTVGEYDIPYTAMDGGFFLNNNKASRIIDGETPQDVTRSLCDEVGVPVKELYEGEPYERVHDGDSLYDIIMTGYTFNYRAGGAPVCVSFDKGALSVVEKGANVFRYMLETDRDLIEVSSKEDSTQAVNRVMIYDDNGAAAGTLSLDNAADFPGVLQAVYKGASEDEARALLKDVELSASAEAIGYSDVKTNDAVVIRDSSTGLSGLFYVDGDTHTWENGQHTMSLTLSFQNIMDEKEAGSEETATEGSYDEAPGNSNQARIWNKCRAFGYTAQMAAAIIGNFQRESNCDPTILQNGVGPGTGLAQWENGSASGRWELLKAWATSNGKDPWTVETQMDWVDHELQSWNASGEYVLKSYGGYPYFSTVDDVDKATEGFYRIYERGANPTRDLAVSIPIAREYYAKWGEAEVVEVYDDAYYDDEYYDDSGTSGSSSSSSSSSSGFTHSSGSFAKSSNRKINMGWPLANGKGTVTQGYTYNAAKKTGHRGWDISSVGGTGKGSAVVAVMAGTVVKAGYMKDDWSYGWVVTIRHTSTLCTRYAHLWPNSIRVKAGQKVGRGQILGYEGNSGNSHGTHLHIEVLKSLPWGQLLDPRNYLKR